MNRFTINGKSYVAPKFDFNTVCEFEEAGISLQDAKNKPTSMIRMYFALLFDGDKEAAGKELEQHMIDGGTFDELTEAMIREMNESRFFQAIAARSDKTDQESDKPTTEKRK